MFSAAIIFSVFVFSVFEKDSKAKSFRTLYLLAIAFGFWFMTMPSLYSGGMQVTTTQSAYTVNTIANSGSGSNTISSYPAINTTISYKTVLNPNVFWSYFILWVFMVSIHGFLLVLYYIKILQNKIGNLLGTTE